VRIAGEREAAVRYGVSQPREESAQMPAVPELRDRKGWYGREVLERSRHERKVRWVTEAYRPERIEERPFFLDRKHEQSQERIHELRDDVNLVAALVRSIDEVEVLDGSLGKPRREASRFDGIKRCHASSSKCGRRVEDVGPGVAGPDELRGSRIRDPEP
jgi:hypothetical protein